MARVLDIDGTAVRVNETLGDYLRIRELFRDEGIDDVERYLRLVRGLYVDVEAVVEFCGDGDALWSFVDATLWEAFGIDLTGKRESDEPVMDWDEDRSRINASARRDYGLSFDELCELSYREAAELVGQSSHESPMGQALYYRTAKPPKATKYNGDYVEAWQEARKYYELGTRKSPEERMRDQNSASDAQFEALKRAAEAR